MKQKARAKIPFADEQQKVMLQEKYKIGTKIHEGVVLAVDVVKGAIIVLFEAAGNMVATVFGTISDWCIFKTGRPSLLLGEAT